MSYRCDRLRGFNKRLRNRISVRVEGESNVEVKGAHPPLAAAGTPKGTTLSMHKINNTKV